MAFPVTCPSCQYRFSAPDHFAGKKGKCPKCAAVFTAPTMEEIAATATPARPAAKPSAPPPAPVPDIFTAELAPTSPAPSPAAAPADKPTPRPARSSAMTGILLPLGAMLGVLAIAGIVGLIIALTNKGTTVTKKEKTPPAVPVALNPSTPVVRSPQTIENIVGGVVKIETPTIGGMSLGSGFVINDKGWIATNSHVIDSANDQTRVLINNIPYKVAGLILQSPEHDMAVIKLAPPIPMTTILDISYNDSPKLASKVRAIGYPSNTFNLTEGIVSNVATLNELNPQMRGFLMLSMKADPQHLWIQHDAKISPGNSGGPLLNEQNHVIGINTWVSAEIQVGYAGHIMHLRDLIATAQDSPKPFPKGPSIEITGGLWEPPQLKYTKERVEELTAACAKINWKPTTAAEYEPLAELAMMITASDRPFARIPPDFKQALDTAKQTITGLAWDADQQAAVNKFAVEASGKPMSGILFVGTMVESGAKYDARLKADRIRIDASGPTVVVVAQHGTSLAAQDKRVLVLGYSTPTAIKKDGDSAAERVVVSGFAKELK